MKIIEMLRINNIISNFKQVNWEINKIECCYIISLPFNQTYFSNLQYRRLKIDYNNYNFSNTSTQTPKTYYQKRN